MKRLEKERVRELRRTGASVKSIAEKVGVSQSSVSVWVRDIPLTDEQKRKLPNARTIEAENFCNLPVESVEQMIRNGLSQKAIVDKFGVSGSRVSRYFKRNGLIGCVKMAVRDVIVCEICGHNNTGKSWKGRLCSTCTSKIRRVEMKIRAVKELGGKCQRCGWVPNDIEVVAMEFHHKDRTKKEFTIGKKMNHKWGTIVREVRKCELLCSRCHRIEHSSRDAVLQYVLSKKAAVAEWSKAQVCKT